MERAVLCRLGALSTQLRLPQGLLTTWRRPVENERIWPLFFSAEFN